MAEDALMKLGCRVLCFLLACPAARAEEPPERSTPFNFNLYIENDTKKLGGPGSDDNYTNGVRLSFLYVENKEPRWVRPFHWLHRYLRDRSYNFGIGLGQQMYTPSDLTRSNPNPLDRPYAGWLYLSPLLNVVRERQADTFELDVGMVGPPALGFDAQSVVHRAISDTLPQGWGHQIGTEMGVLFSFQRKYEVWQDLTSSGTRWFDVIPAFGWGVGNVYDGADVSALVRLGYRVPNDFGPVRPSGSNGDSVVPTEGLVPRTEDDRRSWGLYGFAGAKQSLVAHNIFLDGSTFQDGPRVRRVPLVEEFEAGFSLQLWEIALTWREVMRTPEFYDTFEKHTFASVGVTYGAKF